LAKLRKLKLSSLKSEQRCPVVELLEAQDQPSSHSTEHLASPSPSMLGSSQGTSQPSVRPTTSHSSSREATQAMNREGRTTDILINISHVDVFKYFLLQPETL